MNRRDFQPIFKEVVSQLPQLIAHKRMLLLLPIKEMLCAINFDPSGFDKDSFYVATTIVPLCVPAEDNHLTFGFRLKEPKGGGWNRHLPDLCNRLIESIRIEALPYLESCRSSRDFLAIAKRYWVNPHAPKEAAFALARAGDYEQAIAIIDELHPMLDLDNFWQREMFDETTNLRRMILSDPEETQRKLKEWENYTAENLGITHFR